MVRRFQNWPIALNDVIADRAHSKFRYGKHDCALFVADCIDAMTGIDLATPFRGRYTTLEGGQDLLDDFFNGNLETAMEHIAREYDLPEIAPLRAQRGDSVLRHTEHGHALGIVSGSFCCFAGAKGLSLLKIYECSRAWKI